MPEAAVLGHGNSAGSPSVGGSPDVFIGGRPILRVGDYFADGSVVTEGAAHVLINGRPVARRVDAAAGGTLGQGTVAEGCPRVSIGDCGGPGYGREMFFKSLTDPKDKLIVCLPEMAAEEIGRFPPGPDRQGWICLHECTLKWRGKPAYVIKDKFDNGGQEPYLASWDFLMAYERFRDAYATLLQRLELRVDGDGLMLIEEYLFSPSARQNLIRILEEEDAFSGAGRTFDHTIVDFSQHDEAVPTSWKHLRRRAFQGAPLDYSKINAVAWSSLRPGTPDGMQAALAETTLYAVAAGETIVDGKERRIRIERIGIFIHDGFEFSGEQWLGNWECTQNYKGFSSFDAVREGAYDLVDKVLGLPSRLDNSCFRSFRQRTGYGCDFRIMCVPQVVAMIEEVRYEKP